MNYTGVDASGSSTFDVPGISGTFSRATRILGRCINAGYLPQRINFGGLTGTIHGSDGRRLPRPVTGRSLRTHLAERYDIIFNLDSRGTYTIETDIMDWVTGRTLGTTRSRIVVV